MPYSVIMPTGRIMDFYIRSLAQMYADMYGGVVIDNNREPLKLAA